MVSWELKVGNLTIPLGDELPDWKKFSEAVSTTHLILNADFEKQSFDPVMRAAKSELVTTDIVNVSFLSGETQMSLTSTKKVEKPNVPALTVTPKP